MAPVESATVVKRLVPWLALGAIALTAHTAWNLQRLRRPHAPNSDIDEHVHVLIPARDEEGHLAATIDSVRAQRGVPNLSIHVLDDGSTDGTAAIAQRAAETDPRVHSDIGANEDPPPGWLGKNFACARLAEGVTTSGVRSDVLVFLDADVTLEPDALAALIAELRAGGFDLIAPYPRQIAVGWLERLVQPLLVWSWVTTIPLGIAEQRQWASMSAANGQLLVFDAGAYQSIGGHSAVRGDVIEDVELMREIRKSGMRAVTVDGSHLAQCRMYESPTDLIDGYTKSVWRAFGGIAGSIGVNYALTGLYIVPAGAMIFGRGSIRGWGTLGYAAGVLGRVLVAQRTGERAWPDSLAHPVSVLAFATINKLSWWRHFSGTTRWKGRPVT
jgi:hypothetical protein